MKRKYLKFMQDNTGQAQVEYVLILGAVGLPIYALLRLLLTILTEHYRMLTFFETLPFP